MKHKFILFSLGLALAWTSPPRAGAQWVQTNGPSGGIVTSLFSAGTNLLAGTERESALFRSTDSGAGWSPVTAVLADEGIASFAVMGANGSSPLLFAGTNDSGVFRSTDNGTTWNAVDSGIPPQTGVSAFAVIGASTPSPILFAGTDNGIFLSTDNGISWVAEDSGLMGNAISSLAVLDTNTSAPMLFAGSYGGGVFLSTNNGAIWIPVDSGLTNGTINMLLVSGTNLVVETSDGIFLSIDSGTSWSAANPSLPANNYITSLAAFGTNIFVGTNAGALLSTDEGTSWTNAGLTNTIINALANIGTDLFAGTYGGVFLSTDNGASWISEVNGMINTAVTAFAEFGESGSTPMLVAGTYDGGLFFSTDDGATWSISNSNMRNINFEAMLVVGSSLFAGTLEGVFLSTDSGVSWQGVSGGLPDSASVSFFAFSGTDLFAGTSSGLYRSTDTGVSWLISDSGLANADIRVIIASSTNLVAGGYHGVFLSSNEGISWIADSGTDDLNIFSLAAFGNDASSPSLFAGTANGMFLSTDYGITWTSSGLEGEFINTIVANGTNIFAGTFYEGVFLSLNGGKYWTNVSTGLGLGKNVTSFAVDSNEFSPQLFAGINGSSVWRRPLSQLPYAVTSTTSVQSPVSAYPNPFIGATTVSFTSLENGTADISVVNILGITVVRIYSGPLGAGEHSFTFDASAMPPGMYECLIRAGGNIQQIQLSHLR